MHGFERKKICLRVDSFVLCDGYAIAAGCIREAISRVNDLDPGLLDTNPTLHFRVKRQEFIELVRQGPQVALRGGRWGGGRPADTSAPCFDWLLGKHFGVPPNHF